MEITIQIIISLIIVILIQFSLILTLIYRYTTQDRHIENSGLKKGSSMPHVVLEHVNGESVDLAKNYSNTKYLLFVDLDCRQCSKIISSLEAFDKKYLEKLKIILKKTEDNLSTSKIKKYVNQSYFILDDTLHNRLNVSGFPFIFKIDSKGTIEEKGYVTKNTLIDYMI